MWQGFGIGGSYRGGFCGKLLEASPCLIEPVPAGYKTDLLLAKTEPISDSGSASGITDLRRGKKSSCDLAVKRGVRLSERNSAGTKVSEEGWGVLGTRAEISFADCRER